MGSSPISSFPRGWASRDLDPETLIRKDNANEGSRFLGNALPYSWSVANLRRSDG